MPATTLAYKKYAIAWLHIIFICQEHYAETDTLLPVFFMMAMCPLLEALMGWDSRQAVAMKWLLDEWCRRRDNLEGKRWEKEENVGSLWIRKITIGEGKKKRNHKQLLGDIKREKQKVINTAIKRDVRLLQSCFAVFFFIQRNFYHSTSVLRFPRWRLLFICERKLSAWRIRNKRLQSNIFFHNAFDTILCFPFVLYVQELIFLFWKKSGPCCEYIKKNFVNGYNMHALTCDFIFLLLKNWRKLTTNSHG